MDDNPALSAHTVFRTIQVLTLIPCWATLAALIDVYNRRNAIPPAGIITLFIVALLASIWSFCILIAAVRARNTALWIAFFDICFMGALIAGVVLLANIANVTCIAAPITGVVYASDGEKIYQAGITNGAGADPVWRNGGRCALAKAAWGLGITNVILFFITAILAVVAYKKNEEEDSMRDKVYVVDPPYTGSHSPRRHRHRHRSPRSGEYIVEERF
jgi:hypothetical protein